MYADRHSVKLCMDVECYAMGLTDVKSPGVLNNILLRSEPRWTSFARVDVLLIGSRNFGASPIVLSFAECSIL
jgi:hypothetical protein